LQVVGRLRTKYDELKINEQKDFVENVSILCRLSISVRGSASFCLKPCFTVVEETLVTITFRALVNIALRKVNETSKIFTI